MRRWCWAREGRRVGGWREILGRGGGVGHMKAGQLEAGERS